MCVFSNFSLPISEACCLHSPGLFIATPRPRLVSPLLFSHSFSFFRFYLYSFLRRYRRTRRTRRGTGCSSGLVWQWFITRIGQTYSWNLPSRPSSGFVTSKPKHEENPSRIGTARLRKFGLVSSLEMKIHEEEVEIDLGAGNETNAPENKRRKEQRNRSLLEGYFWWLR